MSSAGALIRLSVLCIVALATASCILGQQCAAPYLVNWPTKAPVWSFCWNPPDNSSGVDGSGLEVYDVHFKGLLVMRRGHLPILNVLYDSPYEGCGGESDRAYRDWQRELAPFETAGIKSPGYAEPTVTPRTACDRPGADEDLGTFRGVTLESHEDRLSLTTELEAGWYRYIQQWVFLLNGDIMPRLGFSAIKHPCTTKGHNHHAYWRFDFAGVADQIQEVSSVGDDNHWIPLSKETKRSRDAQNKTKWRILNGSAGGYELTSGMKDGTADDWAGGDLWALRFHENELDDGGACVECGPNSKAQHIDRYLNEEDLKGNFVVWYRAGYRHAIAPTCEMVGPTLVHIGDKKVSSAASPLWTTFQVHGGLRIARNPQV